MFSSKRAQDEAGEWLVEVGRGGFTCSKEVNKSRKEHILSLATYKERCQHLELSLQWTKQKWKWSTRLPHQQFWEVQMHHQWLDHLWGFSLVWARRFYHNGRIHRNPCINQEATSQKSIAQAKVRYQNMYCLLVRRLGDWHPGKEVALLLVMMKMPGLKVSLQA